MATQVRIVLDTGAFFPKKTSDQSYIDVGYFEPQRSSAIELFVDGVKVQIADIKFGNHKDRIDIQHTEARNNIKEGVNRLFGFNTDLLRKDELYNSPAPEFKEDAFDCILRLHSGDFDSADVRSASFKEHYVAGEIPTGRPPRTTRPIANDIVVDYKLDDGEALKITRGNDELLSTDKIGAAKLIEIRILNDTSTVSKYCNQALDHTGQCCWLPNPNPPPMNG